jgi:acyl-[acyl carrier protein]--UDP-N-acetylglucosamine O-acyltransferase
MKRRKFTSEEINAVRVTYRILFFGKRPMAESLDVAEKNFGHVPAAALIIAFVRNRNKRPLCPAGRTQVPD